MRVVFLDFDGVICHHGYNPNGGLLRPDPARVELINEICHRTGAVVCVSSSWRKGTPVADLWRTLHDAGFEGSVVGKTPELESAFPHSSLFRAVERGEEILSWLALPRLYPITSYVAIDDDRDRGPISEFRWVWVKDGMRDGIQRAHVEAAVNALEVAIHERA